MSTKLLTIIVPSYNMEAYLPKCLESLIIDDRELLKKLDVIVVNDGSKDRTSEIAHEYEAKYPGVFRVIDKANGNYGSCINAAMKIVVGEFVKVLDADDSFYKSGLCGFVKFLAGFAHDNQLDLIMTPFDVVDETGAITRAVRYNAYPCEEVLDFEHFYKTRPAIQMHALTYRTQMIRDLGYVQTEGISYTDVEWNLYPMQGIKRYAFYNEVIYRYLVGRTGQTVDPKRRRKNIWMGEKIFSRLMEEYHHGFWSGMQKQYVYERIRSFTKSLYVDHLMLSSAYGAYDELREFDIKVLGASKTIAKELLDDKFSRKIPFPYIRAVRNWPSVVARMMIIGLRVIIPIANRTRRITNEN